jgi:hypothetical protein
MRAIPTKVQVLLLVASLTTGASRLFAGAPDIQSQTPGQLIEELVNVGNFSAGLHATADVVAFIAVDDLPKFAGGVLGSAAPKPSPAMKELVRRGAASLPALLEHLNDSRPTKLTVYLISFSTERGRPSPPPNTFVFMFMEFHDEYDYKNYRGQARFATLSAAKLDDRPRGDYVVKVGDVCYALIGQIVNRQLNALRYQPSGGVIINSPVEMPDLIGKTNKDWGLADNRALRESLIADATNAGTYPRYGQSALVRLRFYFPSDYQKLKSGDLHARIVEFEKSEAPPPQPAPATSSPTSHSLNK